MMSAIGRNASNILRASARTSVLQDGVKVLPAANTIRKFAVMFILNGFQVLRSPLPPGFFN